MVDVGGWVSITMAAVSAIFFPVGIVVEVNALPYTSLTAPALNAKLLTDKSLLVTPVGTVYSPTKVAPV